MAKLAEAVKYLADSARRGEQVQERMLDTQERTLAALEVLAAQGEKISALAERQHALESHVDGHAKEIYPRLRTLEDSKVKMDAFTATHEKTEDRLRTLEGSRVKIDAFVTTHEKAEDREQALSIWIKGGLAVAAVTAVAGFLLVLYSHIGQITAIVPPATAETRRK